MNGRWDGGDFINLDSRGRIQVIIMNKPFVRYIMSFTRDGSKWLESQYAREDGYDDLVKMAKKKLKKDGVLSVKIDKKTIEGVFYLDKEESNEM